MTLPAIPFQLFFRGKKHPTRYLTFLLIDAILNGYDVSVPGREDRIGRPTVRYLWTFHAERV